jgi:hypothetical protein
VARREGGILCLGWQDVCLLARLVMSHVNASPERLHPTPTWHAHVHAGRHLTQTSHVCVRVPSPLQEVLAHTVNGTTYAGLRARTTGAPQNHWFGPAGDPRAAGIGTPEAIRLVWSCHRYV